MKILLIDDDKDLCYLTKTALTKHGYEVSIFHDAANGIHEALKNKPDLILMDIMLPGINGADAVKALKSDSQLKEIPVIFLTALVAGEENTGLNVNGLNYQTLGKPYEIEKLIAVVQKCIK